MQVSTKTTQVVSVIAEGLEVIVGVSEVIVVDEALQEDEEHQEAEEHLEEGAVGSAGSQA